MPVVTDVDPDPPHRRVEYGPPEIPGPEIELLPETVHVRNMVLAVLAQIAAVGVDHRSRVVEHARLFHLVDRQHHDQPQLRGQGRQSPGRRPRHRFGVPVEFRVLELTEIRRVEQFLETDHPRPARRRLPRVLLVRDHHRFRIPGPPRLDQRDANGSHTRHRAPCTTPIPVAPDRKSPVSRIGDAPRKVASTLSGQVALRVGRASNRFHTDRPVRPADLGRHRPRGPGRFRDAREGVGGRMRTGIDRCVDQRRRFQR